MLVEQGHTRVVCTATVEDKVPPFLKKEGQGWITAEYSMLPAAAGRQRLARERQKINNRSSEIQRFIGRAIRSALDLRGLGERTIILDADVIQADGSTRCVAVNGCFVALLLALKFLVFEQKIPDFPRWEWLAAVSLGIKEGEILADLDYEEDSAIDMDISLVSTRRSDLVEVQAFAEARTVPQKLFQRALALGVEKNLEIIRLEQKLLAEAGLRWGGDPPPKR